MKDLTASVFPKILGPPFWLSPTFISGITARLEHVYARRSLDETILTAVRGHRFPRGRSLLICYRNDHRRNNRAMPLNAAGLSSQPQSPCEQQTHKSSVEHEPFPSKQIW